MVDYASQQSVLLAGVPVKASQQQLSQLQMQHPRHRLLEGHIVGSQPVTYSCRQPGGVMGTLQDIGSVCSIAYCSTHAMRTPVIAPKAPASMTMAPVQLTTAD